MCNTRLKSVLQGWAWRIIGLSLLLLSAFGWLRFFGSLSPIKPLVDFGLYPALPTYLQISGVVIGVSSLTNWVVLKYGHPAGLKITVVVVVIFLLVYWLERFFLWRSSQFLDNWLFMLGLSMLWLTILWIGFRLVNGQKNWK